MKTLVKNKKPSETKKTIIKHKKKSTTTDDNKALRLKIIKRNYAIQKAKKERAGLVEFQQPKTKSVTKKNITEYSPAVKKIRRNYAILKAKGKLYKKSSKKTKRTYDAFSERINKNY